LLGGKYLMDKIGIFGFGDNVMKEGIYTEGFQTNLLRINPVYADLNEPDKDISRLVFTGLTKYDTATKKIVGDMADVVISEDKLTYTFTLKDGIMWHDGQPVTADDVYFTFKDIIQSPDFQNPILKANFDGVTVNKIDNKTISFVLTSPNSFFITNTTVGLLPFHVLQGISVSDLYSFQFNQNPVGTGPYKISTPLSTTNNGISQIVLQRFEQYYGSIPELEKIRFYGYPTRTELLANLNSLNAIAKLSDETIEAVSKDPRFSLYGYSLPQYNAIFFNMNNALLKSPKVRLAMQKAIFKDAFLEKLPNTIRIETPVLSLVQDEWRYVAGMDDAKKLLEDAGFNKFYKEETMTPASEDIPPVANAQSTDAAQPAVTEENAATTTDSAAQPEVPAIEYRENAGGNKLELRLVARLYPEGSYKYNETKILIDYLQGNWTKAGIKINVELYDATILQEKIRARDYDLLLFGQSLGYNLDLYGYFHSTQSNENGLNLSNYKSFKVDTLIEAIRTTFDEEEKTKKFTDLAKAIQEDVPAIFLYRPVYYYASDNKVTGMQLEGMAFPSDRFCHIEEWSFT